MRIPRITRTKSALVASLCLVASAVASDGWSAIGVAVESSGDILWTDPLSNSVSRVAPTTGTTVFLSYPGRGAGAAIAPAGIAVEASGDIVVADRNLDAVVRVDPVTGDRSIVSGAGVGSGPALSAPAFLQVEASGDLVLTDDDLAVVMRVDPVTGDRTILSGAGVGAGPSLSTPVFIAIEPSGDLVVVDAIPMATVLRVDAVTGDRAIVSDAGTGSGPAFIGLGGIIVEASGNILVTETHFSVPDAVLRVDPVTGDRTVVSDHLTGAGPSFVSIGPIALDAGGDILLPDDHSDEVLRIDPTTGDRAFLHVPCPSSPEPSCTTGFGKGQLNVIEKVAGKEKLVAKLLKGPAFDQLDFGFDPTGEHVVHAQFALCVYDDAGALAVRLGPARLCSAKPCWKSIGGTPPTGRGYVYRDKLPYAVGDSSGVFKMTYGGGDAGKTKLKLTAGNAKTSGTSLPTGIAAALSSTTSVDLQFFTESGSCFGTTLTQITKQEPEIFKAR